MKEKYRAPKGFQDIIPPQAYAWQRIEDRFKEIFHNYGYQNLRVPLLEHTEVFARSIGESTDIVEKEMYTFQDRAGRSLTLRPEGTASVVRCFVQNGLFTKPSPQKYYYTGPMFRYERPQKGRFRQFYQIGAEAFGVEDASIDAEMLSMLREFLNSIELFELKFEINSIGCPQCRPSYRETLKRFLSERLDTLCSDCKKRYGANPLRILDCKVPSCIEASEDAPHISDTLCEKCENHFGGFRSYLEELDVHYQINPRLVRGLDYYTSTTFEITTTQLGSQNAVVAGGRYDTLVEEFGGPPTPAIGFALGVERLAELISNLNLVKEPAPALYTVCMNHDAFLRGIRLAQQLRGNGLWCEIGYGYTSLRNQLKKADKLGVEYVFIIGDDEMSSQKVKYKRLRDGKEGYLPMYDVEGIIRFLQEKE